MTISLRQSCTHLVCGGFEFTAKTEVINKVILAEKNWSSNYIAVTVIGNKFCVRTMVEYGTHESNNKWMALLRAKSQYGYPM